MDEQKLFGLKAEMQGLKGILSSIPGMVGSVQPSIPITGPVAVIPALPMMAQAIKVQNETITKLISIIEKLVDEA
jgi:hypothetical protein